MTTETWRDLGERMEVSGASSPATRRIAEAVRTANQPFRIAGAGTWLDSGRPVAATETISTASLSNIVEYVPGDLTMTVQSGVTLAELNSVTARESQWLGLDPAGHIAGTIGGTVATASSGPLATGIGRVRDVVLGLEVVTGEGVVMRAGGRVVKNVAGYDLVRLQTGAWGTLGIITEISLRLRGMPEVDETWAIALDARTSLLAHVVRFRDITLAPLAAELLSASVSEQLGLPKQLHLLVRIAGNQTRVAAQRASLSTLGDAMSVPTQCWNNLQALDQPTLAVARISHLPSQLFELWTHMHTVLTAASLHPYLAHASLHRGHVRLMIPASPELSTAAFLAAVTSITRTIAPPGGHVVWERLPSPAWATVPGSVGDRLSTGLQRVFDPRGFCNPGLLGERQS